MTKPVRYILTVTTPDREEITFEASTPIPVPRIGDEISRQVTFKQAGNADRMEARVVNVIHAISESATTIDHHARVVTALAPATQL